MEQYREFLVPRILYSIINLYFYREKVDSDIDSEEENDDIQLLTG